MWLSVRPSFFGESVQYAVFIAAVSVHHNIDDSHTADFPGAMPGAGDADPHKSYLHGIPRLATPAGGKVSRMPKG